MGIRAIQSTSSVVNTQQSQRTQQLQQARTLAGERRRLKPRRYNSLQACSDGEIDLWRICNRWVLFARLPPPPDHHNLHRRATPPHKTKHLGQQCITKQTTARLRLINRRSACEESSVSGSFATPCAGRWKPLDTWAFGRWSRLGDDSADDCLVVSLYPSSIDRLYPTTSSRIFHHYNWDQPPRPGHTVEPEIICRRSITSRPGESFRGRKPDIPAQQTFSSRINLA